MTKTLVTVPARGAAAAIADGCSLTIRFGFPPERDDVSAASVAAGFLDALTSGSDLADAGLAHAPAASEIALASSILGGVTAVFDLYLHSVNLGATEAWLDASGLLDDPELVSVRVFPTEWYLSNELTAELRANARTHVIEVASRRAVEYLDVVDGTNVTLHAINEISLQRDAPIAPVGPFPSIAKAIEAAPQLVAYADATVTFAITG